MNEIRVLEILENNHTSESKEEFKSLENKILGEKYAPIDKFISDNNVNLKYFKLIDKKEAFDINVQSYVDNLESVFSYCEKIVSNFKKFDISKIAKFYIGQQLDLSNLDNINEIENILKTTNRFGSKNENIYCSPYLMDYPFNLLSKETYFTLYDITEADAYVKSNIIKTENNYKKQDLPFIHFFVDNADLGDNYYYIPASDINSFHENYLLKEEQEMLIRVNNENKANSKRAIISNVVSIVSILIYACFCVYSYPVFSGGAFFPIITGLISVYLSYTLIKMLKTDFKKTKILTSIGLILDFAIVLSCWITPLNLIVIPVAMITLAIANWLAKQNFEFEYSVLILIVIWTILCCTLSAFHDLVLIKTICYLGIIVVIMSYYFNFRNNGFNTITLIGVIICVSILIAILSIYYTDPDSMVYGFVDVLGTETIPNNVIEENL